MFASDLPQIASVFPFQRQSAVFQHPLVRSVVFPAITAVVALAPAAVHQRLYRTTMQVTVSKLSQVLASLLECSQILLTIIGYLLG